MDYVGAINRLAKWRAVFAGRWLGTRSNTNAECIAVRDIIEKYLMLRVEVTALSTLLIERGFCTTEEYQQQIAIECAHLEVALERQFPGFRSSDVGMELDAARAAETMKGWPP